MRRYVHGKGINVQSGLELIIGSEFYSFFFLAGSELNWLRLEIAADKISMVRSTIKFMHNPGRGGRGNLFKYANKLQ